MASIIISSNTIAMEQGNSQNQTCPELPNNFNVPDCMKYEASCFSCGNEYKHISKSAIFQSHSTVGKCRQKLQYKEPMLKFYLKVKCPISGCEYDKEHLCVFDAINVTISKLTTHIREKHNQSVHSNESLKKEAIYYWNYAQPHAVKQQLQIQDEETIVLLANLKNPNKRKEVMSQILRARQNKKRM
jgi:hypothetical protein